MVIFNGNSVQTICYCIYFREVQLLSHCFSVTNDPLQLIFIPCFVPGNCWPTEN